MEKYKISEETLNSDKNNENFASRGQQTLPFQFKSVDDYLHFHEFALSSELLSQGFEASDIEETVNSGNALYFNYPRDNPKIVLYYKNDLDTYGKLSEIANKVSPIYQFQYRFNPERTTSKFLENIVKNRVVEDEKTAIAGLIYSLKRGMSETYEDWVPEDVEESFYKCFGL